MQDKERKEKEDAEDQYLTDYYSKKIRTDSWEQKPKPGDSSFSWGSAAEEPEKKKKEKRDS